MLTRTVHPKALALDFGPLPGDPELDLDKEPPEGGCHPPPSGLRACHCTSIARTRLRRHPHDGSRWSKTRRQPDRRRRRRTYTYDSSTPKHNKPFRRCSNNNNNNNSPDHRRSSSHRNGNTTRSIRRRNINSISRCRNNYRRHCPSPGCRLARGRMTHARRPTTLSSSSWTTPSSNRPAYSECDRSRHI